MSVNEVAAEGFGKGANVYEKARPSYPLEIFEFIRKELPLSSSLFYDNDAPKESSGLVVDLAAGTGKMTRMLYSNAKFKNIVAVEPVLEMREVCKKVMDELIAKDHFGCRVEVLEGMADKIPLESNSVDVLFVAQAFHWFDTTSALKEMARILKPRGFLFLVWNVMDETQPGFKEFFEVTHVEFYDRKTPQYRSGRWKEAFEQLKSEGTLFSPLSHKIFPNYEKSNKEQLINRGLSTSYISALPEERKQELLKKVNEILDNHSAFKGKQDFFIPYNTDVFWCQKL
eukprot:TRINITY_DN2043_c0_g1_i1.p1 TRINITY_DN2043_c0_g1~~TRINITY_DN2043_c0_g1_i1.p1  ORF type:complete len:285 (+),score=62.28 TRINITY_DN2043_c0_g1_i1:120-974(+)